MERLSICHCARCASTSSWELSLFVPREFLILCLLLSISVFDRRGVVKSGSKTIHHGRVDIVLEPEYSLQSIFVDQAPVIVCG